LRANAASLQGGQACDLAAGTRREFLQSGATQHLIAHVLDDLHCCGATSFNFCGANLRSIAAAKSDWGGRFVTHYTIEGFDKIGLEYMARSWVQFGKSRIEARKKRRKPAPAWELAATLPFRLLKPVRRLLTFR
jgi:hypothetical protein